MPRHGLLDAVAVMDRLRSPDGCAWVAAQTTRVDVGSAIDAQFFRVIGGYPVAAALSFTLMLAILVLVLLYLRRYGTRELV